MTLEILRLNEPAIVEGDTDLIDYDDVTPDELPESPTEKAMAFRVAPDTMSLLVDNAMQALGEQPYHFVFPIHTPTIQQMEITIQFLLLERQALLAEREARTKLAEAYDLLAKDCANWQKRYEALELRLASELTLETVS